MKKSLRLDSFESIFYLSLILTFSFVLKAYAINEYWHTLNGPYWVNGVDVAYGPSDQYHDWYRYLIGHNAGDSIYYWRSDANQWTANWNNYPGANRVISYKIDGYGQIAFLSAYGDDIYKTTGGGDNWTPMIFPGNYNNHFNSVEVPTTEDEGGDVVMVATQGIQNLFSTYYYHMINNVGQWDIIGGNESPKDFDVYDIEAFGMTGQYPPGLSIGTENGIYVKNYGAWDNPWVQRAFHNSRVPVLEQIGRDTDGPKQVAAVEVGPNGECNLYYSGGGGSDFTTWWMAPKELKIFENSFYKKVRDMAAVVWFAPHISLYVATDEGLFLVTFDYDAQGPTIPASTYQIDHSPFTYDTDVQAVDGRYVSRGFYPIPDTFYSMVSTNYNIYELKEIRTDPGTVLDVQVSEIVSGTYPSNVTGLSFPGTYPDQDPNHDQEVFTVSDNGIIKNHNRDHTDPKWQMVGIANDATGSDMLGTDVATLVTENGEAFTLVSSKGETDGRIMYSSEDGITWEEHSPDDGASIINSVSFDPVLAGKAYAAGIGVWQTDDNGLNWSNMWGSTSPPPFNDVISDWNYQLERNYYFAGGSGNVTATMFYDGAGAWETIHQGLAATDNFNQLAVATIGGILTNHSVYAASSSGIYKINDYITNQTWVKHDYGTGTQDMGTIVADPYFPYNFLAGTSPEAATPMIWASGDSGRSWNQLYNGALDVDNAVINKLDASQNGNVADAQFIAGTNIGSYYLPNPFKHGAYDGEQVWGPGTVIVNGDVIIDGNLIISEPCTVLVEYNFDVSNWGSEDAQKSGIYILGGLTAVGTQNAKILFTSSKPSNKAAGNWTGIVFLKTGVGSPVNMSYCTIEYAVKGLYDKDNVIHSSFDMENCTVKNMIIAGIDLWAVTSLTYNQILNSNFSLCGDYGIRIRRDSNPEAISTLISGTTILNCKNGIWYLGNGDDSGRKRLTIENCIIANPTVTNSYYGISAAQWNGLPLNIDLTKDSISNFTQGGIWLDGTTRDTWLNANKVKRNGIGLSVTASQPQIIGVDDREYNAFCFNQIGINYRKYSGGKTRWTKIKENQAYGVLVESYNYPGDLTPDFGRQGDPGNNSIVCERPAPHYLNMQLTGRPQIRCRQY
ncbi:MAG TPA: hypothetical protein DEO84_00865 [candidate division Zixibacteria bacterium]|nr:hypothetical protein [candidate division Zixibacteria bacterium]